MIRSVLLSLNYLHKRGLVHRCVNSNNVVFKKTDDYKLRLVDFGKVYDSVKDGKYITTPSVNAP